LIFILFGVFLTQIVENLSLAWKVVQAEAGELNILIPVNPSSELSLPAWYFYAPTKNSLEHKNNSHCSSPENPAELSSQSKPFKRKHQCQDWFFRPCISLRVFFSPSDKEFTGHGWPDADYFFLPKETSTLSTFYLSA